MSDQILAKKVLNELIKTEELKNKSCIDCSNPNPQWASLSFAVFLCLQCAGVHRGFGVHPLLPSPYLIFVRSVSMDAWQDEQIRRMRLGGNAPFQDFMRSYTPREQGGYSEGMSAYDKYHCWAATQYREKLDAMLVGKDWTPSPPVFNTSNSRSSSPAPSSQGLRKSRASARTTSRSGSPSLASSAQSTPDLASDQKSRNEEYFASLGRDNANRPLDLPPSQGGRYTGFGNTPPPSQHPSYRLSSGAAPTLNEFQENPRAAFGKGWSLLSAAVIGASRAVSENVIQPGVEKVTDPTFQATVKGYLSEAQKKATTVGNSANSWSKSQFGVDVAESVGSVVGTVKDKIGGGPARAGYGSLATTHDSETSALYNDDDDDFFEEFNQNKATVPSSSTSWSSATPTTPNTKQTSWDDDWKDF
ncbi:hypothetical protein AMATHDRAFT_142961 [Amanita thiersii Skay4041]|uniref:Arf-GAP domain-containing protein n=1 Tax=Amanita thiersii Skay4041 TaxID=703135 RepID=A0A2A9NL86_9AGAR|nr:hypothetical protein AMATHDRAFT_142961 [Amanita thiersii Skay4041]